MDVYAMLRRLEPSLCLLRSCSFGEAIMGPIDAHPHTKMNGIVARILLHCNPAQQCASFIHPSVD